MKDRICTLSKNDLKDLVKTYRIPLDLYPHLHDVGFTMDHLLTNAIGIYYEFLWFSGIRVPFSTFLLSMLKYFKVHISHMVLLGLNKVVSFEVVCHDLNIVPTVTLFRVFQCLCKQGDWFSFSKHCNTEDICMDDGPSSLNKWKDKFFLIDHRADDVQQLCARLICLCEMREAVLVRSGLKMSIYNFMTLPSCSDAKIVEESHHLSLPLLERVPSHTTALASKGAIILMPTPDEIPAIKKRKLQKRASEAGSSALELGYAKGVNKADLANLCAELEDSLERDEGVSTRAVAAPIPHLGKRLGAPPSIAVASVSKPSHIGTSALAPTSGRSLSIGGAVASGRARKSEAQMDEVMRRRMDPLDCLARSALARDVEYDQILDDDFGIATRGKEIDLTLFPLAPGPYRMPYPYKGVSSPLYTREEWNGLNAPECNVLYKDIFKDPDVCRKALDRTITPAGLRRIESLLPLELSTRVNVLSALLVTHGYKLDSRYTNLVSSRAHFQEKLDKKKGDVELLRSEVTSLDSKLENLQRDCDALGQENIELRSQRDVASEEVRKLRS
ncbi:hypothetical protein Tco_1250506 [Tanacetum coccineum]